MMFRLIALSLTLAGCGFRTASSGGTKPDSTPIDGQIHEVDCGVSVNELAGLRGGGSCYDKAIRHCPYGFDELGEHANVLTVKCHGPEFCDDSECSAGRCVDSERYPGSKVCSLQPATGKSLSNYFR